MPKLPEVEQRNPTHTYTKEKAPVFIAAFLAHRTPKVNGKFVGGGDFVWAVAAAVRAWFDANPEMREQFIKWYEAIPEELETVAGRNSGATWMGQIIPERNKYLNDTTRRDP